MVVRKPVVLIAGARSQDELARALQQELDGVAETTMLSQETARLSAPVLESRLNALETIDCAVFITPRAGDGTDARAVQDAMLELGLMLGRLGPQRTLLVVPDDTGPELLPTSLRGLAVAEYDTSRTDDNARATVAGAGTLIRETLRDLPRRTTDGAETDFGPDFDRELLGADTVFVWGMNQSDFLIRHYDLLEGKLRAGASMRALFVRPDGTAVTLRRFPDASVVVGVALAAVPWASWVAGERGLPLWVVRPSPKAHGLRRLVEGTSSATPSGRAVIVEDALSTGSSIERVRRELVAMGVEVLGAVTVLDYELGTALRRERSPTHALYTWTDLREELGERPDYSAALPALDRWFGQVGRDVPPTSTSCERGNVP